MAELLEGDLEQQPVLHLRATYGSARWNKQKVPTR